MVRKYLRKDECPVCKEGTLAPEDDLVFEDIDLETGKKTIKKYPDGTLACDCCSYVEEEEKGEE